MGEFDWLSLGARLSPPSYLRTSMIDMVGKKSKKSFTPSKKHLLLGIPSNIAVGPLGFRAELDIDPEGR